MDTPTRQKVDLSGRWDYSLDDGESGTVKIPSAYTGKRKVTFVRTFGITAEQLDHYQFQLVMLGVNYSAEVSINGEFVGNHSGGYTTFLQPIPKEFLQVGSENRIQVSVNPALDPRRTIPARPQVWQQKNYGGILRDVYILATPLLSIRETVVATELAENGATAKVSLRATVEGRFAPPSDSLQPTGVKGGKQKVSTMPAPAVFFEVVDRISGTPVSRSGLVMLGKKGNEWEEVKATALIDNPRLWTPDTPELYILKSYLVVVDGKDLQVADEYDVPLGVRHLVIQDANFVLNGRRLILKGVLWNEQHPTWGSSLPYEQMEKDVVMIKNLGANLIRFAEHPPHPYMLDLCDRYGLLAMVELPVNGVPGTLLGEEAYDELATGMMREMIVRDRSHPSVLAWGIGDDLETSSPATHSFVGSMAALARTLDARPLYYATRLLSHDLCSDLVDIAALDVSAGELKTFKMQMEAWRDAHSAKPVVAAKMGVEVQPANRSGYSDPLSQEAQARFFLQRLDALKVLEFDGAILWAFNDWHAERPALTVHGDDPLLCSVGLVSAHRERRIAYEAVRAVFRGEKFGTLPAGNHSAGAPIVYVLAGFVVLVGVAYLYNANRRFRESVNRSFFNTYNFFADVRDQRIVSLIQTTVLGLVVSMATAIVLSSMFFHFRDNRVLDNILGAVLVSDDVKAAVVRLVWHPVYFIVACTGVLFFVLLLASFGVLLLKAFFRTRIFMFHAYAVTMWSTTPLLLFIPVGMILYQVMDSSMYVIPSLVLVGVLFLWVMLRFLKGVSIIFDVPVIRMDVLGFLSVLVVVGLLYLYYDSARALPDYVTYMVHVAAGS